MVTRGSRSGALTHRQVIKTSVLSSKLYSGNEDTLTLTLPFLSYFWGLEWVNCCMKYHRDTFRLWWARSSNFCQLDIFLIKPGWKVLHSKDMNKTYHKEFFRRWLNFVLPRQTCSNQNLVLRLEQRDRIYQKLGNFRAEDKATQQTNKTLSHPYCMTNKATKNLCLAAGLFVLNEK